MVIPRLALKNLFGAGLRTWLNVVVLSFAFVAIIGLQGIYNGMNDQAVHSLTDAEYGGGQYWQENYDPYEPLSLPDAHAPLPEALIGLKDEGLAAPVLIVQGTIYPSGRIQPVLLKGINPEQSVISIPTHFLAREDIELPALIGTRMAKNAGLKKGDTITVRWRDAQGTFDARDAYIVEVMRTTAQSVDRGQMWVPLNKIQELARMPNEASLVVLAQETEPLKEGLAGWDFKNLEFLLKDITALVQSKTIGGSIMYSILVLLAMLAIFNTQVLSIFRRRKEMGTLMALGFTRVKVIKLFTLEGAMHGVLAAVVAAIYGTPLLVMFAKKGWAMPDNVDSYGFAIGDTLLPTYGAGLIIGTTVLVLVVTTIVSFLPTRKIAKLKPTDALRGRMS
jgi:ABC-type lipoprotein release transport system permease subunit